MIQAIKNMVHTFGHRYIHSICDAEWRDQKPKELNERPMEYSFVFRCLGEIAPSSVLDVGTGKSALPSLLKTCRYQVTAIDNMTDYWPKGMLNRHFRVQNDDITRSNIQEKFDAVICISVLEHIADYERALENMLGMLLPGGHLVLTCPYHEHKGVMNCYEEPGSYGASNPYPCRQYTRDDFQETLGRFHAKIVKQEWWQFFESDIWSCGPRIQPPKSAHADQPHQHSCILIQVP